MSTPSLEMKKKDLDRVTVRKGLDRVTVRRIGNEIGERTRALAADLHS